MPSFSYQVLLLLKTHWLLYQLPSWTLFYITQALLTLIYCCSTIDMGKIDHKALIAWCSPIVYYVMQGFFLMVIYLDKLVQKEEYLKIHGLNSTAYKASWVIHIFLMNGIISSLIIFLMAGCSELFNNEKIVFIVLNFLLYGLAASLQVLFLSLFINTNRRMIIAFILNSLLIFPIYLSQLTKNIFLYGLLFQIPQTGLGITFLLSVTPGYQTKFKIDPGFTLKHSVLAWTISCMLFLTAIIYFNKKIARSNNKRDGIYRLGKRDSSFARASESYQEETVPLKSNQNEDGQQRHKTDYEGIVQSIANLCDYRDISLKYSENKLFCFLRAEIVDSRLQRILSRIVSAPSSKNRIMGSENLLKNVFHYEEKIGVLTNMFSLFQHLTLRQNLHLIAGLRGVERSKISSEIKKVLKKVGLFTNLDRLPQEVSEKDRWKLRFAATLLGNPKIIFFEEGDNDNELSWRLSQSLFKMRELKATNVNLKKACGATSSPIFKIHFVSDMLEDNNE